MLILRDEKEKGREKRERELYLLISSFRGGTDNDWLLSSFILLLFCFFVFFSFLSSPPFFPFHPWDGAFVELKIDKGR